MPERKRTGRIAPTLPADRTGRVALIGPHARTHLLLGGNYFEDICPDPENLCTALSGPISTILTVLSWMYVCVFRRRVLSLPERA